MATNDNPIYDLMTLLHPAIEDERRDSILSQIEQMITADGELIGRHDWGLRALAFEIAKETSAHYYLFQFHGPSSLLERLDHQLKITDGVLRFRIIKLEHGVSAPPAPPAGTGPKQPEPVSAEPSGEFDNPEASS